MKRDQRQQLVEQRATNGATVQFVADRQAEMADAAEEAAKQNPEWAAVAAAERTRRDTLQAVAENERRLATAIQMGTEPDPAAAASERELRKDLLEIARAEKSTADALWELATDDNPTPGLLAEQAERNCDLLRHVADTATQADRELRGDNAAPIRQQRK